MSFVRDYQCYNKKKHFLLTKKTSIMLHPLIKWAQRKDKVFIQIQLRDITNQKISLTQNTVAFEGQSDSKQYNFTVDFFDQINKQQSRWNKTGFHLLFAFIKKDPTKPFWPRLTKQKQKNPYILIDWDKWVDDDQEKQQGHKGLANFDPSQMQNFNFGNLGGAADFGEGLEDQKQHDKQDEGNLEDLEKEEDVQQQKH